MAFDQVTTVATAGLKERTSVRVPRWLVAILAAIPIIAGGYLVVNSGELIAAKPGKWVSTLQANSRRATNRPLCSHQDSQLAAAALT
jgi:hypothetical protein